MHSRGVLEQAEPDGDLEPRGNEAVRTPAPITGADIGAFSIYITIARLRPGFWRCAEAGEEPMDGRTQSSSGLDERRRKLSFRAWHRGMREVDLIMGQFADAVLAQLTEAELDEFERLIEVPDGDLLAWVTGEAQLPADFDTALFRRLREFNHCRERPG